MTRQDLIRNSITEIAGAKQDPIDGGQKEFLDRACDIIIAFLNKNSVAPDEVPGLITAVHSTLSRLFEPVAQGGAALAAGHGPKARLNIRETVTPDYIVCLEDGKHLQTLKRYIGGRYGLTPEQYRQKWNLPDDYPMVAPNYAKRRSQIAKEMGLGRKRPQKRRKRR